MINRLPPQPPPANQRLYNQQVYSGYVLTIDGHLTYSPFTDVDITSPPVGAGGVANWIINDPDYFYNTTRGVTIDRTGSFVKIYNQFQNIPIATAIILDANFLPNTIQIKVIKFDFGKDISDLDPSTTFLKIRLEDNWKFCSSIPDWIPADAESRDRWIPIMGKELEPSLGQKLNLRGGVASTDGLSIPLVLDTSYQDNNRLQRLFAEEASTYKYTNTSPAINEVDVDNVIENFLTAQASSITVSSRGNPTTSVPDYAGQYTNYPFLNPTGLELALPEPWFIDTEAIIATTRIGGIAPPPPAFPSFTYGLTRGIDSTPKAGHSKYSIIFNGMPFPIGQTCKLWEIDNFTSKINQDWLVTYRGMIENIPFSQGLASTTIELSSLAFTSRVNSDNSIQQTQVERREVPERDPKRNRFFDSFLFSQVNVQDTFLWIKINNIAFPIVRVSPDLNYLQDIGDPSRQRELLRRWGLKLENIEQRLEKDLQGGTTDVGYEIGFINRFGDSRRVSSLYSRDDYFYTDGFNIYSVEPLNWFRINFIAVDPVLPSDSPWGFYILDRLSDQDQHEIFIKLRRDNDIADSLDRYTELREFDVTKDAQRAICDYISDGEATLIHLFQRFCKGLDITQVPDYASRFWYITSDTPNLALEVRVVDVILQVLTSTGSGSAGVDITTNRYVMQPGINGAWDLIPREMSLGIPLEEIDLDSFARVINLRGGLSGGLTVSNMYIELEKQDPQKFLEDQILKPFFLSLATDSTGKIILVDMIDIVVSPETKTINPDQFVRKGGATTRVSLTYDAQDLVDSFTYSWFEPIRTSWEDPYYSRSITASGITISPSTRLDSSGQTRTIKSKARLFPRIQRSPIKYELNYSPANRIDTAAYREVVGGAAIDYLSRFNRIVPRAKFELFWDAGTSPDIGDTVAFNLDAIPNKEGLIGDDTKIIIGKIIDIKVDRKAKVAEYTAILTDSAFSPQAVFWNLTAQLVSLTTTNTWRVSQNLFCFATNPARDSLDNLIWEFDYSQFSVGSTVIVWDKNWRFVTTATIVNVNPTTPPEIEFDNDTLFQPDYRITLETVPNSTTIYSLFITWFGENQQYAP